jgi:putative integral membrane protein (TIGR02587 family)
MISFSHQRTVGQSLREYGRGIAGGLMFSVPLFYTQEMWDSGISLHPGRILLFVGAIFGLLLSYNRYSGLRRDASLAEIAIDSVEETGIGLVLSAGVLALVGRIGWDSGAAEALGKVVMEAMTVAIGVSVGTAQLGTPEDAEDGGSEDEGDPDAFLPQMAIALCGAVLFAANVAPTEEVVIVATESSPARLLGIAGFSLAICALVFHFADFRGAKRHVATGSWLVAFRGIVSTYAVSLAAAAGFLWFFGRLDGEPLSHCLAMTVALGLPAVLGASAGRLLLQTVSKSS